MEIIIILLILGLAVMTGMWLYERSNTDHYRKMADHHLRTVDQLREIIQKLKSKNQ